MAFLGKAEASLCIARCRGNLSPTTQDGISHHVQKRQTGECIVAKEEGRIEIKRDERKERRKGKEKDDQGHHTTEGPSHFLDEQPSNKLPQTGESQSSVRIA